MVFAVVIGLIFIGYQMLPAQKKACLRSWHTSNEPELSYDAALCEGLTR